MAENQTECLMTGYQVEVTNIVFTSASFCSFIFGLISVVVNRLCYHRYKDKQTADPTEGIFILALIVTAALEMVDSFQWILLLNNDVACTVLGAVKQYVLVSTLVTATCLGIHLVIVMTQPRCLQVIKEVKVKRYSILQRFYIISALLVPVLWVPWPFISIKYGRDEYICWVASSYNCSAPAMWWEMFARFLVWHFWAVLVWIIAVAILIVTIYRYCAHKSVSISARSKIDVCTLITLLLTFIIVVMTNIVVLALRLITGKSMFLVTVLEAVFTHVMGVIYSVVINVRQVKIRRSTTADMVAITNASLVTHDKSYEATHTNFTLPGDEWN